MAAHLCPATAIGWKTRAAHPSKPCRTTSVLAGRSYASAGQAASVLHSMAVLQVYQAKLLSAMDESEPDLRELRSATDLALRTTKTTSQAIGRSIANLVVLERHLWLMLTEIKDADKVPFLDAPISPNSLFGPAVEGFAERFTKAQKSSQAMRHFLPKRSSSAAASSRPKPTPTQQPVKPAPAATTPQPATPGPPTKQPLLNLFSPRSSPGAEGNVFVANTGPVQAPKQPPAVIVGKIKHKHSQKERKFPLLLLMSALPPCSRSLEFIQPLAMRAECLPRSVRVGYGIIKRGYSLQFARRPPRFSGVVSTLVQSKNTHVLRSEVMTLLEKGAIERVPQSQSESGFYSRYFLVPK